MLVQVLCIPELHFYKINNVMSLTFTCVKCSMFKCNKNPTYVTAQSQVELTSDKPIAPHLTQLLVLRTATRSY